MFIIPKFSCYFVKYSEQAIFFLFLQKFYLVPICIRAALEPLLYLQYEAGTLVHSLFEIYTQDMENFLLLLDEI